MIDDVLFSDKETNSIVWGMVLKKDGDWMEVEYHKGDEYDRRWIHQDCVVTVPESESIDGATYTISPEDSAPCSTALEYLEHFERTYQRMRTLADALYLRAGFERMPQGADRQ